MYYPGMDCGLAKIRYAEILAEAAQERASRRARASCRRPSTRRLVLAVAALAPIVLWIVSTLAAH